MLLQKTLHMSQSLAECKARLASIQSYRRQFLMVTKATVTSSKTVDFSFRGPLGFEAHTVLLQWIAIRRANARLNPWAATCSVMGLVDFTEIRPHCTEVTLAVHYEIKNKFFAWLDRRLHFVDAFLTSNCAASARISKASPPRLRGTGARSCPMLRSRSRPDSSTSQRQRSAANNRGRRALSRSERREFCRGGRHLARRRLIFALGSRYFLAIQLRHCPA